jgi:hypothetical protein
MATGRTTVFTSGNESKMLSQAAGVTALDPETQMDLQSSMLEGEHLLWSGHPPHGLRFRLYNVVHVFFGLLWCGFMCYWEYSVVFIERTALFLKLWGIPGVLIGLFLLAGPFFVDARRRQRTIYGITDKRVLIVTGSKLTSLDLQTLPTVSLMKLPSGGGFVNFFDPRMLFAVPPGLLGGQSSSSLDIATDAQLAFDVLTKAKAQQAL